MLLEASHIAGNAIGFGARLSIATLGMSLVAVGCKADVTYEDVYPIVVQKCNGCHLDGVSPLRPYFFEYEKVAEHARVMRDVIVAREMPPFGADNSTACGGNFFDDQGLWLSPDEIALFSEWLDTGAKEGDPSNLPEVTPATQVELENVSLTVDVTTDYTFSALEPQSLDRCFVIDTELDAATSLRGFSVRPGSKFSLQNVQLFALDSEAAVTEAQSLEAAEPTAGYSCYGGPLVESRFLGGWVWGGGAVKFPRDSGVAINDSQVIVARIHFNAQGAGTNPAADASQIEFDFGDVAETARYIELAAENFALPPGLDETSVSSTITIGERLRVLGVAPFMQLLGQTIRVSRVRPFATRCLFDSPNWLTLHNLRLYNYLTDPPQLIPGDQVKVDCSFVTRPRTEQVFEGVGRDDEQCTALLLVADDS